MELAVPERVETTEDTENTEKKTTNNLNKQEHF